jgi:hypothetical protein
MSRRPGETERTKQLRIEARRLRAEGLTIPAISVRLVLSKQRIAELLGKSDWLPIWTKDTLALLGKMTDRALARQLGCHVATVVNQRKLRGIKAFSKRRGAK